MLEMLASIRVNTSVKVVRKEMSFEQDFKRIRTDKNMTQQEVADALHVSRQTVSAWERGKNYPSLDVLRSISELFDVSFENLLFGEVDEMPKVRGNVADEMEKDISLKGKYRTLSIVLGTLFTLLIVFSVTLYVGYQKGIDKIDRINPFLQYNVAYTKLPSDTELRKLMKNGDGRWTAWFSDDDMGLEHTKLTLATGLNPGIKDPYVMAIHKGSFVREARIVPGAMINPLRKHDIDTLQDYFKTGWDGAISQNNRDELNKKIRFHGEVTSVDYDGQMMNEESKETSGSSEK